MSNLYRTAALAVISLASVTALGGSVANGAILEPMIDTKFELPAAVVEAASIEDTIIIPQSLEDEAETKPASSLVGLVSRHVRSDTLSREDECLAVAVYFESKGESLDGQLAVAHTVINRAKSGRFPGTLCGVVLQPSQFSFVRGGGFPNIARSSRDWREAVAIAHIARADLWQSSVSNALFFHATRVSPGWRLKRIAAVGNHVFYR